MLTPHDILWSVVFPALLAVAAVVSVYGGFRRRGDRAAQPWGPALAVAGGFLFAYVGIAGRPPLPPVAAQGWLVYAGAAAVLVAVIATMLPPRGRLIDTVLSAALLVVTAWLLSRPRAEAIDPVTMEKIDPRVFWAWTIGSAVAMVAWYFAMEWLARRRPGGGLPLLLSAAAGSAALVLVDSGSMSLGQITGGIALPLLVLAAAGWWFRDLSLARGGALAVAVTLLGMLLAGYYYAELTPRNLAILAGAPLAAWLAEIPPLRRRPRAGFAVAAVVTLAVLTIAVAPAIKGLHKTMKEQTESTAY